jgi:hypothetical protein
MVSQGQRFAFAPFVPNTKSGEQILQSPGGSPYTMFTFTRAGRIWAASVSIGVGVTGGSGTQNAYARVRVQGGVTLAITECVVAGATGSDSNGSDQTFPGLAVPANTVVQLDVNAGGTISGGVLRASGVVVVSIP